MRSGVFLENAMFIFSWRKTVSLGCVFLYLIMFVKL